MSLYTRLLGLASESSERHLPIHEFRSSLGEYERGKLTAADVYAMWNLDAAEQAELNTLYGKIAQPLQTISIGGFAILTNVGLTYDGTHASGGGGHVQVEYGGINAFAWKVGLNRNAATGTIFCQLWNDTEGVQVAEVSDTAGAGNKFLPESVQTFTPVLAPGIRSLRVRIRSTVAADDPAYLGSSLLIRRVGIMTSAVLEEILMLARGGYVGLGSEVALKARLGV